MSEIKVRLVVTITVDIDEWLREYGEREPTVREDVRTYALTLLRGVEMFRDVDMKER